VERIENPILIDVPLENGSRPVRVELHGRTELVVGELPASITPVVRDEPQEKDFLAGFLDAVVLSLLPGHHVRDKYHAHVIPGSAGANLSTSHRVFHGIDELRAREYLMVFEYVSKKRSIESSIEEMKENENKSCSSRYGPVPNFEAYDPPDEEEAHRIIERRFGLFREAGGLDI
jgi:exodeoxyribonuclease V gamma subunit